MAPESGEIAALSRIVQRYVGAMTSGNLNVGQGSQRDHLPQRANCRWCAVQSAAAASHSLCGASEKILVIEQRLPFARVITKRDTARRRTGDRQAREEYIPASVTQKSAIPQGSPKEDCGTFSRARH
jgi:hypothetical protein